MAKKPILLTIDERFEMLGKLISEASNWTIESPLFKRVRLSCAKSHIEALIDLCAKEAELAANWPYEKESK